MQRIFRYLVSDERPIGKGLSAYSATLPNDRAELTLIEWTPSDPDLSEITSRFVDLIDSKAVEGFVYRHKFYAVAPAGAVDIALAKLRKHDLFGLPLEEDFPHSDPGSSGKESGAERPERKRKNFGLFLIVGGVALIAGIAMAYWFGCPRIEVFSAESQLLDIGDAVTVSWSVQSATEVYLTTEGHRDERIALAAAGQRPVRPSQSTTYLLVAYGWLGMKTERRLEMNVRRQQLKIVYFRAIANPSSVDQPIRLSWQVDGAERVEITPGFGVVGRIGSEPAKSEIVYTLRAAAPDGHALTRVLDTRNWDGSARVSPTR